MQSSKKYVTWLKLSALENLSDFVFELTITFSDLEFAPREMLRNKIVPVDVVEI